MGAKKSEDTPPPTTVEDAEGGNKNYIHSFPSNQRAPGGNIFQRPMGTGIVRGNVNKVSFNVRQPPTLAPNNTMHRTGYRTSPQPSSNAKQNTMRSLERMPNNTSDENYNPIDRPCDAIFEEDRENAGCYNRLDEIDNEIIVTGAVDVPKCYETWRDANFHPTLHNAIMKSGYTKPKRTQAFAILIIADGFDLICQSEAASGKTGAYLLPIIDEMLKSEWKSKNKPKTPYVMIIALTRELVIQISEYGRKLCEGTKLCCTMLYGQKTKDFFKANLDSGCDILIATRGRLTEFLSEEKCTPQQTPLYSFR
uniref:ATP-dependent RNA helicase n=1 Tax=Strongyloides papillosus TaxID=174720 RepID=A0A0N5CIB5_STREA